MAVESWITPEETPALAEAATAMIEDRLSRFPSAQREAYWASIRKCYNTPYNPPAPKAKSAAKVAPVIAIPVIDLPVGAMVPAEMLASVSAA